MDDPSDSPGLMEMSLSVNLKRIGVIQHFENVTDPYYVQCR